MVLILDKDTQSLPWESLPAFRSAPLSRSPSLFHLASLHALHVERLRDSIEASKIVYVLNPENDVAQTQARLQEPLEALSLGAGYVGAWPSPSEFRDALTSGDALMYCGHGAKMKTLSGQEIERLSVRAVPLLFGCNSGRMERFGRNFDPVGACTSYLIAASPCLLGFLWSVTDLDLDNWTMKFLEHWLGGQAGGEEGGGKKDFVRAVGSRRHCFKKVLNSAATVVYGLPAFLEEP